MNIFLFIVSLLSYGGFLYWANSKSPLWGERYMQYHQYDEMREMNKEAEREATDKENMKISSAHYSISAILKDPSSAKFSNERVFRSGVVCGYVN